MSTEILLLIGAIFFLFIVFIIVIWFLFRNRGQDEADKKDPEIAQETTQPIDTPVEKPKDPIIINDPPGKTEPGPAPIALEKGTPVTSKDGEGKIRILIVDDNADTVENVKRLLYFEDDMEVLGQAYDGREGIERAKDLNPHIVLMDINMPDMDGITATQIMGQQTPYAQVIIMSVQSDSQYMRQAMSAGARDFQPKPFTMDELVGCVRRVYNLSLPIYQQYDMAQTKQTHQTPQGDNNQSSTPSIQTRPIIVVYSPKGGTGTTAVAANLAIALQEAYKDIVLVDANLQFGDVMVHLHARPERTISNLIGMDEIEMELLSQVLVEHKSGLKLLLAPPKPEDAELISPAMLSQIVKSLKSSFNAIIVDTATLLTEHTLAVLDIADYILVVTTPELTSVKNTKLLFDVFQALEFPLSQIDVIVNRADIPNAISPEQIKAVLKLQQTFSIPNDPKIHIAINRGQSVFEGADPPVAQQFTMIAEIVWEKVTELHTLPA